MELKIYTDRMKDGQSDSFKGTVSTTTLLPKELDVAFSDTLELLGEAYVAGDHLIIKLKIKASAWIPCAICNELVETPIILDNFYHAEPLEAITAGVFDFSELLRNDLLLELPHFAECQGKCPQREHIKKFLTKTNEKSSSQHAQFPFSGL